MLTKMDSLLLRHPTVPSDPEVSPPEPKMQTTDQSIPDLPHPQPRTETIKAAMPPQPLPRTLQRSTSDLTNPPIPTATTKRRSSGLLKSYSNGFTPLNVVKPPPLLKPNQIRRPTSHGLALSTRFENRTTELIPDSRPGSAREQTVDAWSREAFDLFGFDGMEKRVGTGDGGGGGEKAGGGLVRGEDGWLVASQGFV
ncbi:MAG: hypothetical protein Q9192_003541 [Flavoplaca navasiana]